MKTHVLIAGAVAVAIAGGGYTLAISPQRESLAETRILLEDTRAANEATVARIPRLKEQLATISPKVDYLKTLSTRVPPTINLPDLYTELDVASAAAGIARAENVSVTAPMLVVPVGEQVVGEVAAADTDSTVGAGAGVSVDAGVIASYSVTMGVRGTGDQIVAFLQALSTSPRLNVVSTSSVSFSETANATITATYYLQQVDVDQIAQQIEALSAGVAIAGGPPAAPSLDADAEPVIDAGEPAVAAQE